jgi:hypothetical protein
MSILKYNFFAFFFKNNVFLFTGYEFFAKAGTFRSVKMIILTGYLCG